jgi:F-type H+-transporting ATPase subunit b
MDLVTPDVGLIFWTTISFLILLFILGKFAWKPILNSVNERETSILDALEEAEKARKEMQNLKSDNERILKEARAERDEMMKDARQIKNNMLTEAKDEAKIEANKIIAQAKTSIEIEKHAAIIDIKNQVAELSIGIAEKVVKSELADKNKQVKLVEEMLKEITIR